MVQKYIITDIDGVVLDWEEGFSVCMGRTPWTHPK